MESYNDIKLRHQREVDGLPIAFAFNSDQLAEAKAKLGNGPYATFGAGSLFRKADLPTIRDTFTRHENELKALRKSYKELENGFVYEMANYEFDINSNGVDDVLRCFCMTENDLNNPQIKTAWNKAKIRFYASMRK